MATKFRRKDNGEWCVMHKGADGRWKTIRCGKSATAAEAETVRKRYDAEELNRRHTATVRIVDMGLADALADFRDTVVPRSNTGRPKSAKSVQRYKAVVNNFIHWFAQNNIKAFSAIREDVVIGFFDDMINNLSRSASTTSKHRQLLINFFDWSIARGYCTTNPGIVIKNPKRERKIPLYYTSDELCALFAAANEPYRSLFKFLYLTGMRIGEVGNLEWRDYNQDKRYIIVRVAEGNKTKRECVVPLNASAVSILDVIKASSQSDYIFVNSQGGQLDNARVYSRFMEAKTRAGIKAGSPHTLRHTCASHLAIKGISLYVIKEILRHASIKETEIYAHLSTEAVAAAIETISA